MSAGSGELFLCVLLVGALGACGPTNTSGDGGGGSADAPGPDASIAIPWLSDGEPPIAPPALDCPSGWREVSGLETPTCDPYPEDGPLICPDGQAHFPGEATCTPIGSPCPTGEFSDALPADTPVVYVRPLATRGDGTEASPYGSLTEFSIVGLMTGSVIALSPGTHQGPVRLVRGVALWGACTETTRVTTSEASATEGVLTLRDGELHDLTVSDSPRAGVFLSGSGSEGLLDGVLVTNTEGLGVYAVDNAQLTVRNTVVRGTRGRATDGQFGRGMGAEGGASLDAERVLVEQNRDVGVFVGSGGTVRLDDAVVRDTDARQSDLSLGRGLNAAGGTLVASRVLVSGNHDVGVFGGGLGSLMLTNVVVRDTHSRQSDGTFGRGLNLQDEATAVVERAVFDGNREVGVYAADAGTMLTMLDVVVHGTLGRALDGAGGRGLGLNDGAMATVVRALVQQNHDLGVYAVEAGTSVSLEDTVVRSTQTTQDADSSGRGLAVSGGATATLSRGLLEDNHDIGVFTSGTDTMVRLSDVMVRNTMAQGDGSFGRGLEAQRGAAVELTRTIIERSRDVGVFAADSGTNVSMVDAIVRDTLPRACAETWCSGGGAGHGASCHRDVALTMTGFSIASSALCGLIVDGGQVDLLRGEMRDNAIGVCIQVDGYDLSRLMTEVSFANNDLNLDSTTLPVPEPAAQRMRI